MLFQDLKAFVRSSGGGVDVIGGDKDRQPPEPEKMCEKHGSAQVFFSTSADAVWAVCPGHRRRVGNTT